MIVRTLQLRLVIMITHNSHSYLSTAHLLSLSLFSLLPIRWLWVALCLVSIPFWPQDEKGFFY